MKNDIGEKRILFLTRLYLPHIGGVEKHISKVSDFLRKKGHSVTIICEQDDKNLKTMELIGDIKIIRIPILLSEKNKKIEIWRWVIKNRKLFKDSDVVHIHDVFYWIIPLIFSLDRRKIYMTFHGYEGYPVRLSSKIQKKIASVYCSGTIMVGDFIKKWYKLSSNAVIYGGVNISRIDTNEANRSLTAVFFGRLDHQTGIKEYYEAFQMIKKKHRNFKFEAIGEGEYKSRLTNISISPFKSRVDEYVQNAQFVFVSGYLSMLEAMSYKKIVISVYTNPLKKDYLLDSPFRKHAVICASAKEIAAKVEYYLEHPEEEKKITDAAFSWAKKQTWKKIADVYLKLWQI